MPPDHVLVASEPDLTPRAARAVLAGLLIGVFMSALDGMIMVTSLRTVADSLHGLTALAWVTSSYLITMTISAPLYGKLSDLFGRKQLYLIGTSVFMVGSLLCAVAGSVYQLAIFRGIQGLGAGGLASLALAAIADLFPPDLRVRYQANVGVLYGVASVVGPVAGGLFAGMDSLLGLAGWRWIFLVNLPIGLMALVLVGRLYTVRPARISHRIDFAGALCLVLFLVPLLLVAEQGREWGWSSRLAWVAYALGGLGLVLFLMVERAAGETALLPLDLFRAPAFAKVNVVNFLGGVCAFTALSLIPLYLQIVKGMSPITAGLLLLPQSIATTAGAKLCGPVVARTGRHRILLVPGLGLMGLSYAALAMVGAETPTWPMVGLVAMMGLGQGMFLQTVLSALQDSVPPDHLGVASGLYGFSRQIGGVVGTSVFVALFFSLATGRIVDSFRAVESTPSVAAALADPTVVNDPDTRTVVEALRAGTAAIDLNDTSALDSLDPRLARPILEGFSDALGPVFWIIAALAAVAAVLALTTVEQRTTAPAPAPPEPNSDVLTVRSDGIRQNRNSS